MNLQKRTPFDWEDLRLFLETARHPKLADAAARLHIDPTTLGRRIRRFETEIGTSLFERTPQGLAITPEGQTLLVHAEQMEQASLRALESLGGEAAGTRGTVRISAAEGFGAYVVAPALARFSSAHPHVDVDLVATSGFLSVSKREADIAVLLTRPTTGRLVVRKLSDYVLGLYAAPSYLETAPPVRAIEDLKQHRLIGYVEDLIYSPRLRYLDEFPSGVKTSLRSSSIVGQYQATRAGAGLCVLPCFIADRDPDLVRILPHDIRIARSFWLAVHEDIRDFARIRAAVDFLLETVDREQKLLLGA